MTLSICTAQLNFVVGDMPGALASTETLHVVNVGLSGALVESAWPLPEFAEYQVQLVRERHVSEATVKVRRVVAVRRQAGEATKYQIGLEFLSITAEAEDEINRLIVSRLGAEA